MTTAHFHQNDQGTIDTAPCDAPECPRLNVTSELERKPAVPLERGHERPSGQYNDFKRCHNPDCLMGFFANATAPQRGMIQCPNCDETRERLYN